jgi:hypothetical protein
MLPHVLNKPVIPSLYLADVCGRCGTLAGESTRVFGKQSALKWGWRVDTPRLRYALALQKGLFSVNLVERGSKLLNVHYIMSSMCLFFAEVE